MNNQVAKYSQHLLSKENKDVVKFFEESYVENQFRYYLSLKVPVEDIIKFFHKAQVTGADPLRDQIYLIPRQTKVNNQYVTVGTVVFSYHFVEEKAVQTKEYQGYTEEFAVDEYFNPVTSESNKELRCTVIVKRNGHDYPYTAWWPEYVQSTSYGVTMQWKSKPRIMLRKCALAGALRAAFPEWLSGVYTQEEMGSIEKDDETIEAEFSRHQEVKKVNETKERIQSKIHSTENVEVISGLMDLIKEDMSKATRDIKTIEEKGRAMFEILGVRKFDELKNKSVEELKAKSDSLKDFLKEKESREKANKKPTFIIGDK
jgi:phage recombination protein Bet